jgi:multiple sugar transport system substrate-binding protein
MKKMMFVFSIFLVVSMLVSCAPKPTTAPATVAPAQPATAAPVQPATAAPAVTTDITLEFQQWFDNEMEKGYMQSVTDAYTAKTGVKIKLLSNPYSDTKTQIAAGAAAGTMADIVAMDGGWIYDYATQGALADLGALFTAIGFDTSTISAQTTVKGTVYVQPLVNFPSLMAVNLDLLNAKGITTMPETWSEFLTASKAVTDPANNIYGFGMNMSTENASCMSFFAAFAWNSGGTILTSDGKPYMANNQIMADTTDFFKSLFTEKVVVPGMFSMTDADKVQEFVNGRIAFMPDSVAHLSNIVEQAPNMNITYINMPHQDSYTGTSYIRVNNWGVGISSNSKHPEEAAKFIAYLLSPEVNADLAVHSNSFPVNTAAKPAYTNTSSAFQAIYKIYMSSKGKSEFDSLPTADALQAVLDVDLVKYIEGEFSSASEMLNDVQAQFDAAYK